MNKPNELIIVGGGTSIPNNHNIGLWSFLANRYTISVNYSYRFFTPTIECFCDKDFYSEERTRLESLPLIIGKEHQGLNPMQNTILLRTQDSDHYRDIIHGIYKSSLTGIFALTLGIYLLDIGTIYCLGYDGGEKRTSEFTTEFKSVHKRLGVGEKDEKGRERTHFYQNDETLNHRGIGKISYYNTEGRTKRDWGVYKGEKNVKIYNVSKASRIETFETITYAEFFTKAKSNQMSQEELREWSKKRLKDGGII